VHLPGLEEIAQGILRGSHLEPAETDHKGGESQIQPVDFDPGANQFLPGALEPGLDPAVDPEPGDDKKYDQWDEDEEDEILSHHRPPRSRIFIQVRTRPLFLTA